MTVIVTDTGFGANDWTLGFVPLDEAANDVAALDVPSSADPADVIAQMAGAKMIRVDFPSFADGR
ncbi:MAG: oxidoreductase, partial [Pseudomonadota bacterium]|nr:oxidoreductase [Pseudomonadota bacterium]